MRKTWKRHSKHEVWKAIQDAQAQGKLLKVLAYELDLTPERLRQVKKMFAPQIIPIAHGAEVGLNIPREDAPERNEAA